MHISSIQTTVVDHQKRSRIVQLLTYQPVKTMNNTSVHGIFMKSTVLRDSIKLKKEEEKSNQITV